MRKQSRIILSFTVCFSGCSYSSATKQNDTYEDIGSLITDSTKSIIHTFSIFNSTGASVKVIEVKRSCSCTSAELSNKLIPPYGSVALKVKVDVKPTVGEKKVVCTAVMDSGQEQNFVLTFRVYPTTRFNVYSINLGKIITDKGEHPTSDSKSAFVECYELAPKVKETNTNKAIKLVEAESPLVAKCDFEPEIDYLENRTIKRTRFKIEVKVNKERLDALQSGSMLRYVKIADINNVVHSLPVTFVNSESLYELAPANPSFGMVRRKEMCRKKIIIRGVSGVKFMLLSREDADKRVDVDVQYNVVGSSHLVSLTLNPSDIDKAFLSGKVTLRTDIDRNPTINVPWSAILHEQ